MKRNARKSKTQYTIRAVPAEVDQALRRRAQNEGRSLNDVAVEALTNGAGISNGTIIHRDLDHLIGSMKPDPKFDAAIEEMRQVEPEMWR